LALAVGTPCPGSRFEGRPGVEAAEAGYLADEIDPGKGQKIAQEADIPTRLVLVMRGRDQGLSRGLPPREEAGVNPD
jgi:hypothetical protein